MVADPGQLPDHRGVRRRRRLPAVVRLDPVDHQPGRGDADGAARRRSERPASTSRALSAATTAGLQQVPVTFTVIGPSGTTTVYSITDYLGNAIFPPPSGSAARQLHGDPGVVRRRRDVRADDDHLPDSAAGLGTEARTRASRSTRSPTKTFGDPDFALFASASSGLAVSFGASGACTVAGNTVHLTGTGSCTITADQAGDATYNAAATVTQTLCDRRTGRSADRALARARGAESDDGRHRHVHADVQRAGHRRHDEQLRGRARAASPRRRSPGSAAPARRGR